MTDRPPQLDSLFLAALEITSSDERARYLDSACGADHELRRQVELLLRSNAQAGSFLNRPAPELEATIVPGTDEKHLAAVLAAGLAPAFNDNQAVVVGSAGHSVLQRLGQGGEVPRVVLRDAAETIDPLVRPKSPEMPLHDSDSRYRLDGEIARGGMGAILKGRDTDLGRELAIKVLLDAHKDKPEVIQRFIEEAQIGGQLQHPGIAPVYELGQFADRRPFFSMKLVKGETLSKLLADRKDPADDRGRFLGIFEQVCQTMAYAHSRGVIHRDLKPANIMVGAFGEVQVMDWGLAKVLPAGGIADEKTAYVKQQGQSIIQTLRNQVGSDVPGTVGSVGSHTQMGSVMGTPAYMPPEQALGEIDALDERADVFGLGAILCEILTGKPPYVGEDGAQVFRMASRGKLRECLERLDACGADTELTALTKHCLELEPSDRPRNANALAERITAYLESVETKLRQTEVERAAEAARVVELRRRRKLHYAIAVMLLAGLVTAGFAAHHFRSLEQAQRSLAEDNSNLARRNEKLANDREAERNVAIAARESESKQRKLAEAAQEREASLRNVAEDREQSVRATLYATEMNLAAQAAEETAGVRRVLEITNHWMPADNPEVRGAREPRVGSVGATAVKSAKKQDLRGWEWYYLSSICHQARLSLDQQSIQSIDWSPNGRQIACADKTGAVAIWDVNAGARILHIPISRSYLTCLAYSPDGSRLAVGGTDHLVRIYRVGTSELALTLPVKYDYVNSIVWRPDGRQLATVVSYPAGEIIIWDTSSGERLKSVEATVFQGWGDWSPDGSQLIVSGRKYNAESLEASAESFPMGSCAFSPSGTMIAVANGYEIGLVAADSLQVKSRLVGHVADVASVRWSHDEKLIASAARDDTVRVWSVETGREVATLRGHTNWVLDVQWSPDDKQLVSGGNDCIKVWDFDALSHSFAPESRPAGIRTLVWNPEGTALAAGGLAGVQLLDCRSGRVQAAVSAEQAGYYSVWSPTVAWNPTVKTVAALQNNKVMLFDDQTMQQRLSWELPTKTARAIAVSPDGQRLATSFWHASASGQECAAKIFDTLTGKELAIVKLYADNAGSLSWSPDGSRIACAGWQGGVIADGRTGAILCEFRQVGTQWMNSIAWHPAGDRIAVGCDDRTIVVFDAATGKPRQLLQGHTGSVRCVSWNNDGTRLASGALDKTVRIWDPDSGTMLLILKAHRSPVETVAWSPDRLRLATASDDGDVRIWDAFAGYRHAESPQYLETLNRRLDENPDNVADLRVRMNLLDRLGDHAGALRDRKRCLAILERQRAAHPDDPAHVEQLVDLLMQPVQGSTWSVLKPIAARSGTGTKLTALDDGSILVSGTDSPGAVYTVTVDSPLKQMTAIRLEVLPDTSLPSNGPGRHESGNFQLAALRLFVTGRDGKQPRRRVPFRSISASYTYQAGDTDPFGLIDDSMQKYWHIWGRTGQAHSATLQLTGPLTLEPGQPCTIELAHRQGELITNLGRFRLLAADSIVWKDDLRRMIEERAWRGDLLLAAAYLTFGDLNAAEKILQTTDQSSYPHGTGAKLLLQACLQAQRGQSEAARQTCLELAAMLPSDAYSTNWNALTLQVLSEVGGMDHKHVNLLLEKATFQQQLAIVSRRLESEPSSAEILQTRGLIYARLGQLRACADDYLQSVKLRPTERLGWCIAAAPLVLAGDRARYEQHCRAMLEQFRGTNRPEIADIVCKAGLLLPDVVKVAELPVQVLRDGIANPDTDRNYKWWFMACNTLVNYRDGKFADAIDCTRQMPALIGEAGALGLAVRAMAEEKTGQHEQALKTLATAEALIPIDLRTLGLPGNTTAPPLQAEVLGHDWLVAEILRREAVALIRRAESKSGDNMPQPSRQNSGK